MNKQGFVHCCMWSRLAVHHTKSYISLIPFLLCIRVSYMFADLSHLLAGYYSARQICYHYDEQRCCTWGWIPAVRFAIRLCLSFHFTLGLSWNSNLIRRTTFFLTPHLGGDSQMNELIWYSWLGGVIIGTMIGANSVLEEHCKAGPRNVVITGRYLVSILRSTCLLKIFQDSVCTVFQFSFICWLAL
jgi:hypothetical protein